VSPSSAKSTGKEVLLIHCFWVLSIILFLLKKRFGDWIVYLPVRPIQFDPIDRTVDAQKNKKSPKDSTKVPTKVKTLYAALHSKQQVYLSENLMSVSQLVNKDFIVVFACEDCKIYHKNDVKIEGVHLYNAHVDNLFKLNGDNLEWTNVSKVKLGQVDSNIEKDGKRADNLKTWHKKLGHINNKDLIALSKWDVGIDQIQQSNDVCVPCQKGKQSHKTFSNLKGTCALDILDLVHSDLVSPLESSLGGSKWILTFIDDFSRMAFTYFLKSKDQVFSKFKDFKATAELETGRRIKTLRTGNGHM
jgi:hypothetical protein